MEHRVRAAPCQQGNLDMDSGKMNKKYNVEVLMMLKIWNDYYLDASRVCYTLKKAHTKADGGVEYNICTYHTRLEEALAEAVRRTIREGVASGELKEWEQVRTELQRLESEVRGLLQSIFPAEKEFAPTLKNDRNNKCA